MIRRLMVAMSAVALFALVAPRGAVAHEGHDHKVMGVVTMAAADHVMVKGTDGKDVTIQVTKDTKVTRDKLAMKAQDIKPGTRVVVTARMEKDVMKARTIQVGVEAAAAKTAAK
jgi:ABC-type uncharacterized transport system substrate-binding protein